MTGRHLGPRPSLQFHQARHLGELEAKARPRYFHDALFHSKVKVAVHVLDAMFPDADPTELSRAALLVLAAVDAEAPPDPGAVAALMGNLQGRPPITYASGHGVTANHNGDPVCVCGWDPARELPREVVRTQADALRQINAHSSLAATAVPPPSGGWD